VAGSTLEISISNSCAILAAGTASPNCDHPKSGLLGPPQEGKGRNNNLSPPNIVSNSMISPPVPGSPCKIRPGIDAIGSNDEVVLLYLRRA